MYYVVINIIKVPTKMSRPFKFLKIQVINNQVMITLGKFININRSRKIFQIISTFKVLINNYLLLNT